MAGSRLYLQERIADRFLDEMVGRASRIVIGDPLDEDTRMGPLATTAQLDRIEREVATAVEEGGTILHGGRRPAQPNRGWYYEPTIIDCPRQSMRIVDTELFGPVLSVLRFRDEEEVVGLANDTRHGLAAGIFTRDGARALRVARAVRAGIVWVKHLSRDLSHRRVRRPQGLRLRARERLPGHLRLHAAQDGLG